MQNILYRAKSTITPELVFSMQAKGFDVQDAEQAVSFPDLIDNYKVAFYNAALKYGDMLSLEQAFQAKWLQDKGCKAQVVGLPNILEFVLPQEYCPTDPEVKFIHECINPNHNESDNPVYQLILIDKESNTVRRGQALPNSLVKDFGYLAHKGVHMDKMPIMLQQFWYQRDKVYYHCTEESILEEVKGRVMLQCYASPGSQRGQVALSNKRGEIAEIFGYTIPAFMISKIVSSKELPRLVTASNAPDFSGIEVESGMHGKTVLSFDLLNFLVFLLDKFRPFRTGRGTIPFNISPLALLSAFLWETRKEVPHINIRNLPNRKELVTLLNQVHQYEYGKWLATYKKDNNQESVLEYFETIKHWSQSDSTIKKGVALFKNRPKEPVSAPVNHTPSEPMEEFTL